MKRHTSSGTEKRWTKVTLCFCTRSSTQGKIPQERRQSSNALASQRVSPGGGGWAQRHAQDADLGPMLGEAGAGLQDPEQGLHPTERAPPRGGHSTRPTSPADEHESRPLSEVTFNPTDARSESAAEGTPRPAHMVSHGNKPTGEPRTRHQAPRHWGHEQNPGDMENWSPNAWSCQSCDLKVNRVRSQRQRRPKRLN